MNLKDQVNKILNNKTSLYIIIAVLGISLSIGIFRYIELNREKNRYIKENELVVLKYKMTQQKIDTLYNENQKLVTEQKIVETQSQSAINQLSAEVFKLKKKDEKNLQTIAFLSTHQSVDVDSLDVAFEDTPAEDSAKTHAAIEGKDSLALAKFIQDSTVIVPKKASYSDSAISISETITKQGFTIDSLHIPNTLSQRIVLDEGGWFKKDSYKVQSFNTSKYFGIDKQQSVIYAPSKKSGWVKFAAGVIIGGLGYYYISRQ
jgi:hypothetical protein